MAENMALWDSWKTPPDHALKKITGGRLKGMTDISPMWRIQALTEQFGPCGIGWYTDVTSRWMEPGAAGEFAAFAVVHLYVKVDGEWSKPIDGSGGAMFVANEKNGPHTSDEAFKMAETDALSVCCKKLGVAADIYYGKGDSKYQKSSGGSQSSGGDSGKDAMKPLWKMWYGAFPDSEPYGDEYRKFWLAVLNNVFGSQKYKEIVADMDPKEIKSRIEVRGEKAIGMAVEAFKKDAHEGATDDPDGDALSHLAAEDQPF